MACVRAANKKCDKRSHASLWFIGLYIYIYIVHLCVKNVTTIIGFVNLLSFQLTFISVVVWN